MVTFQSIFLQEFYIGTAHVGGGKGVFEFITRGQIQTAHFLAQFFLAALEFALLRGLIALQGLLTIRQLLNHLVGHLSDLVSGYSLLISRGNRIDTSVDKIKLLLCLYYLDVDVGDLLIFTQLLIRDLMLQILDLILKLCGLVLEFKGLRLAGLGRKLEV